VAETVDLLWFYFGYSSYFTLHDDNGWSYERAEHWLADQAIAALLSPPGQPALNEASEYEGRQPAGDAVPRRGAH